MMLSLCIGGTLSVTERSFASRSSSSRSFIAPELRPKQEIFDFAQAYKTRFKQEAVMRVIRPARIEFID